MSDMVKIPSMRPEPKRDRYGRYVLPDANGHERSWTRATTLKDALKDKEGLINWKRKMTALGMARRPDLGSRLADLHAEVEACGNDWRAARAAKDELNGLLDELHHEAGGDEGSERGTQAHTLTEYADAGRLEEVRHLATEEELADLAAYLKGCDAAGIERPAEYIERVVLNLSVESAGTLDRLVRLADGRLVVGDVKSQQSVSFGWLDMVAQLAQYANADGLWDDENQVWTPMPADLDKSTGIIMHVPVGKATCDIYEIDLETGWQAALVAHEVRRLRSASKAMGRPYIARPAQPEPAGDRLLYLINAAGHPDALVALYREFNARGEWAKHHTRAAKWRKATLLEPSTPAATAEASTPTL